MKTTAIATQTQMTVRAHGKQPRTQVVRRAAPTKPLRAGRKQSDEVRELIEAAGPLDVENIAAGLDWPIDEAQTFVSSLVCHGRLHQDEWDRFGLAGDWR